MSKIIFKKSKNIIDMHFGTKNLFEKQPQPRCQISLSSNKRAKEINKINKFDLNNKIKSYYYCYCCWNNKNYKLDLNNKIKNHKNFDKMAKKTNKKSKEEGPS